MSRTRIPILALAAALTLVLSGTAYGQFTFGGDGSDGPLVVSSYTVLPVPADGIFNFTTIDVQDNQFLSFQRNDLNTPIYLLATGDVTIAGTIRVNGSSGNTFSGGAGGPGGYDGGAPGFVGGIAPGAGHGPGGGLPEDVDGSAGYGGHAYKGSGLNDGQAYGSSALVPLVGGSGSGGRVGSGGGGGGGAILIASNTRIDVTGEIEANGAGGASYGSGGAIRLVAPTVSGNGYLETSGGYRGWIRVDTIDRQMSFGYNGNLSVGNYMVAFPPNEPRLDILEAAGQSIPEGTGQRVSIDLPFGSPTQQTVTVQGRNLTGLVAIEIVLVNSSGDPVVYPAQLDFTAGDPAQTTVTVDLEANNRTDIFAWKR